MRERRGVVAVVHARELPRAARAVHPEARHGDVHLLAVLEVVRVAPTVGLAGEREPVFVAARGEASGVVLGQEVGKQPAEVLAEPLALVDRADHVSGEDRQVRQDRVADAPFEGLLQPVRPVLAADLPAVDVDVGEAARGRGNLVVVRLLSHPRLRRTQFLHPDLAAETPHVGVEVAVERLGGELVDLEAVPRLGRQAVPPPVADVAEAEDRPLARGDVPRERSVRRHLRRQVDDPVLRDHLRGGEFLRVAGQGRQIGGHPHAVASRLDVGVGERRLALGRWIRENRDVGVEPVVAPQAREPAREARRALHDDLGMHRYLHRVGRRDPRSAGRRPAGAVVDAEHEPEPLRLVVRVAQDGEPFVRRERHLAGRDVAADVEDLHAAEARPGEFLEVARHALLRDVAVHHVVPRLRLRRRRRRLEPLFKRRRDGPGRERRKDQPRRDVQPPPRPLPP